MLKLNIYFELFRQLFHDPASCYMDDKTNLLSPGSSWPFSSVRRWVVVGLRRLQYEKKFLIPGIVSFHCEFEKFVFDVKLLVYILEDTLHILRFCLWSNRIPVGMQSQKHLKKEEKEEEAVSPECGNNMHKIFDKIDITKVRV